MRRNVTKCFGAAVLLALAVNVNAGGEWCTNLSNFCFENNCSPWIFDCAGETCQIVCGGHGPACNWGPTSCRVGG